MKETEMNKVSTVPKKLALAILYALYFFVSFILILYKTSDVIVFAVAGLFLSIILVVSFYDTWKGVLTSLLAIYFIDELWVAFLTLVLAILGIGTLKIKSGEIFESFIKASGFVLTVYGFTVKSKSHRPKLLNNIDLLKEKPIGEWLKILKNNKLESS